jgi:hypothetical protein
LSVWREVLLKRYKNFIEKKRYWFFFVLLLGVALRLYKIESYDLWYDEAHTLFRAQWAMSSLKIQALFRSFSIGPFLYEAIIFIGDHFAVPANAYRYISAFFSALTLIFSYKLFSRISDKTDALWTTILLAVSPFQLMYAQEISQYALFMLLSIISFYYFLKCQEKAPSWSDIAFYMMSTALLFYAHYFGVYVLGLQLLIVCVQIKSKKHLVTIGGIVLAYAFLLIPLFRGIFALKEAIISRYGWIPDPPLWQTVFMYMNLIYGFNLNESIYAVSFLGAAVMFARGLIYIIKEFKHYRVMLLVLVIGACSFVRLGGAFLKEHLECVPYLHRYFCFVSPFLLFVLVLGMRLKPKMIGYAGMALVVFGMLYGAINYYRNIYPLPEDYFRIGIHKKKSIQRALSYLEESRLDTDKILVYNESIVAPVLYYRPEWATKVISLFYEYSKIQGIEYLQDFIRTTIYKDITFIESIDALSHIEMERMWFVYGGWDSNKASAEMLVVNELDKLAVQIDHKKFPGVSVYLYDWEK